MVSLIVPVYNVAEYLRECLDSILNQSYTDYELLLVDDGSTDASGSICEEYAAKDSRITVFHQANSGVSAARNVGTRAAKGEYIGYVDADDTLDPNYLQSLLSLSELTGAEIAVCGFSDETQKRKQITGGRTVLTGAEACDRIVNLHETYMIVVWGKLFSVRFRELLLMPEGKIHEDEFVTYRVLYSAESVAVTGEPLYHYRNRSGSISREQFRMQSLDKLEALQGAAQWLGDRNETVLQRHAQKRYLLAIEIMWRKAKLGGADSATLRKLWEKHRDYYSLHGEEVRSCSTGLEKFTMDIFSFSPGLYRLCSGLYILFFGKD